MFFFLESEKLNTYVGLFQETVSIINTVFPNLDCVTPVKMLLESKYLPKASLEQVEVGRWMERRIEIWTSQCPCH
jgi:hypothetical protein